MQVELERVMALQPAYSARLTPEMAERGELVRNAAAEWLETHGAELAADIGISADDLLAEGRDGTGLKTRVPWVRFSARSRSPRATDGFYAVYLFDTASLLPEQVTLVRTLADAYQVPHETLGKLEPIYSQWTSPSATTVTTPRPSTFTSRNPSASASRSPRPPWRSCPPEGVPISGSLTGLAARLAPALYSSLRALGDRSHTNRPLAR